ncbi:MAG: polysaccharide biosynthesis tyrosine autokinase [Armatimonadetes bacterium]|nr:polysaccharide biosynthesis tyrosine autokinase [Armatimonadota bacterium]
MDAGNNRSIANFDSAPLVSPHASPVEAERIEIGRAWGVFCRRWKLMLAVFAAALVLGAVYIASRKPIYESTAKIAVAAGQPVPRGSEELALLNDLIALSRSRSVESQLEVITSADVLGPAARRLGTRALRRGYDADYLPDWAVAADAKRDSDVISIRARAYDPDVAARLANSVLATYTTCDRQVSRQAARQGRQSVYAELSTVQDRLSLARGELARCRRETGLVAAEGQSQAIAENALTLKMELDRANADLASAGRQVVSLRRQMSSEGSEIQESRTVHLSPQYQAALTNLSALNAQRITLVQEYAPTSSEVRKIDGAIADAKRHLAGVARNVVAARVSARNPVLTSYANSIVTRSTAQARVRALREAVAEKNREMADLPDKERMVARLAQKVGILEHTYQVLSEKYYALLVDERSTLPSFRLITTAHVSRTPATPDRRKNAILFFVLAVMAAMAAAFLADRRDDRVRDAEVFTQLVGSQPLSIIPNRKRADGAELGVKSTHRNAEFIEAFRILRNNIFFAAVERPINLLAITSPGPGEGKSLVSANLASAVAADGRRVLLVDCDLRRPALRSADAGLTELVRGVTDLERAVVNSGADSVYRLPSGSLTPNPAELLNSAPSRELLESLARQYDMVILDCPPCSGLSDMQVISKLVDGVLLVLSPDTTREHELDEAMLMLARAQAPVFGYVLNRLNVRRSSYRSYYGRGRGQEFDRLEYSNS